MLSDFDVSAKSKTLEGKNLWFISLSMILVSFFSLSPLPPIQEEKPK